MTNEISPGAADETHISSLVVQAKPASIPDVTRRISTMTGAEVPIASPKGKLVVYLETATLQHVTNSIDAITKLSGVLGCTLVSHHVEDSAGLDQPVDSPPSETTETTV